MDVLPDAEADELLWARALAGDGDAFASVFDRHADAVHTHCAPRPEREHRLLLRIAPADGIVRTASIEDRYLDAAEYAALRPMPARTLHKTRHSIPPLGVDVFSGALEGLVLGEAEFPDDAALHAFVPPPSVIAEVTSDTRLSGGRPAAASASGIRAILAEYGIIKRSGR